MDGADNVVKRQIAVIRRSEHDHPPLQIDENSRLCQNCNMHISSEIEIMNADPHCLRLNVLTQTANRSCIICYDQNNVHRLSVGCRVNVFIRTNIYVPDNVRACGHHLDEKGFFFDNLLPELRSINRPCIIKGTELMRFLNHLRDVASTSCSLNENDLDDEEFQSISPISKAQFNDLFTHCNPVEQNGKMRNVRKKDLLAFLCKMKHGLSDDFIRAIFDYKSRQTVSSVIDYVRRSLMEVFVPQNIGPESITREDYINQHVTEFSNILYNSEPNQPKAIAVIDSTYAYVHKSSNFRVLRQSFSVHKNRHLLKPTLVVAPDGFILDIFGPYFADSRNNDAGILRHELNKDGDSLRDWFQDGDIVLVDRGYRDAAPILERLGIQMKMPSLLQRGRKQLSTEEANASRIITKNRWIVESRNGHLRLVFKFFANTINVQHARNLNSFYRIAGAILNKYHPTIIMEGATVELARGILQRSQAVNVVQARIEVENLIMRRGQWRRLHHRDIPEFPILNLEYLKHITIGIYQVNLSPSYIQDKVLRENDEEFQLDEHINEPGFIRVRLFSRYRAAKNHQIFISYPIIDNENPDDANNDVIDGYYCTCPNGARTLGACAHVASILWFFGFARHQENIKYPESTLLNNVLDAGNREANE